MRHHLEQPASQSPGDACRGRSHPRVSLPTLNKAHVGNHQGTIETRFCDSWAGSRRHWAQEPFPTLAQREAGGHVVRTKWPHSVKWAAEASCRQPALTCQARGRAALEAVPDPAFGGLQPWLTARLWPREGPEPGSPKRAAPGLLTHEDSEG